MEIHEYQVKRLFQKHGVPILKGGVAYTPEEAVRVAESIGGARWVVKAQIHDGCRDQGYFVEETAGDGSGIRYADSLIEVQNLATQMLGKTLITPSTHQKGHEVKKVYVEEVPVVKEKFHISLRIEEDQQKRVLALLRENGQFKMYDLTDKGITTFLLHRLTNRMKLMVRAAAQMAGIVRKMYDIFETPGGCTLL
ncbi:MAG: ATP-grasp domain-containing protein [Alphaproteobacteria bacterium]